MKPTYSQTLEYRLQVAVAAFVELLWNAKTNDPGHVNTVDKEALLYIAERMAESQKILVNLLRRSM